ncbi:hypothetical protein Dde_0814 [Oleidesulfovibrio alaskensis G20]|jgi:hypothetical protein|uniref:Uncharacterized protein n=1 Tax=Oleidesulfovibrio alaskensis (strain ATCC BAA-1058 / DSM 17464 / G20) TaxID=207559 RepID=Q314N1_OLEA2|nr:hypothetical protein [Oleidesulfovibrio alaskensis]ABB37615.1 hypothetical protein Dde_0814 [Oleidesulfovibrio alaskensis G20]MBG0773536.1 hypothetical protein [Oleidesulfovibrio alaskensis]MBL3581320.1 hypothetical protein [Oleidesulfovibrio alaskensis]
MSTCGCHALPFSGLGISLRAVKARAAILRTPLCVTVAPRHTASRYLPLPAIWGFQLHMLYSREPRGR